MATADIGARIATIHREVYDSVATVRQPASLVQSLVTSPIMPSPRDWLAAVPGARLITSSDTPAGNAAVPINIGLVDLGLRRGDCACCPVWSGSTGWRGNRIAGGRGIYSWIRLQDADRGSIVPVETLIGTRTSFVLGDGRRCTYTGPLGYPRRLMRSGFSRSPGVRPTAWMT